MNTIQRIAVRISQAERSCRERFPLHRYGRAWIPSAVRWRRRAAESQAASNPATNAATLAPMASRP
jgi:hypothetical protein